ncbi:uncharacterized protein PG998_008641 [Apiospora kogelbergensis]|uniref:uncharacterized protein n=1 Tax=Apiospora kogelbergensis TaxID=1337665 RepID=UPI003131033F
MQLHLAALLLSVAGLGSAGVADLEGVRHAARQDYVGGSLDCAAYGGANGGANGGPTAATGPSPRASGGTLSCVAQSNLGCTNTIQERGKNLCRARVGNNRYQDGTRVITNLNQAQIY